LNLLSAAGVRLSGAIAQMLSFCPDLINRIRIYSFLWLSIRFIEIAKVETLFIIERACATFEKLLGAQS
jgi:hypothetical protein